MPSSSQAVRRAGRPPTAGERAGGEAWSTPVEGLRLFLRGATVGTAARVALVVGTVLSAVNQGSVLLEGQATGVTWLRVAVNYCVPFVVASLGYLSACRARSAGAADDPALVAPAHAPRLPGGDDHGPR